MLLVGRNVKFKITSKESGRFTFDTDDGCSVSFECGVYMPKDVMELELYPEQFHDQRHKIKRYLGVTNWKAFLFSMQRELDEQGYDAHISGILKLPNGKSIKDPSWHDRFRDDELF